MGVFLTVLSFLSLIFPARAAFDPAVPLWSKVLQTAVTEKGSTSVVDYAGLKRHPDDLNAFVKAVEAVPQSEFDGWQNQARVAFLLNTYNAYTVKLAVDNFPLRAFKDIGGVFANPWRRRDVFKLFGQAINLEQIEARLRSRADSPDPRWNFALSNASKGGPRLGRQPYSAERLEAQLDEATRSFVADRTRNGYSAKTNTFDVSQIFKWHSQDFVHADGSIARFLAHWMKLEPALNEKSLESASIHYLDYDWSLNN